MGQRIRDFDWAATDIGPPSAWPAGLRAAVQMMLTTRHPVFVFWGPQHRGLYNDAYSQSLGADKQPAILGQPGRAAWAEIWPIIGPQIDQVMTGGESTWHENQRVPILRNGVVDDVYWTCSYGPIGDDDAPHGVGGVLVLCNETTTQMLERRASQAAEEGWRSLFAQTPGFTCILRGPEHRFEFANPRYEQLMGGRPLIGLTVAQALPEALEQGFVGLLDNAFRSAEAYVSNGQLLMLRGADGVTRSTYVDFVFQPILDDGRVTGIFVQGSDVSDRVRAAAALSGSEGRWRALVDNLPGAAIFVIDTELRYQIAVGEALSAAGISGADLVGRNVADTAATASASLHLSHYQRALDGHPFELEHRDHDRFYLTRGVPLQDGEGRVTGVLAASYDITARRQVEEDLRRARAQLDAVLSAAEVGIYCWRLSDDVVHHDQNLARLYGLPESTDSVLERHWEHIHPDDRAAVQAALEAAKKDGHLYIREYRTFQPDGSVRWLSGRGRLQHDESGQPEVLNGLVIDISDLKKLEESLLASDRHKDHFLAVLAHELRNPLAPLLSAARLLGGEPLDVVQAAWCRDVITRQVQRMAVLLDDLFNLSAIKYGRLRMEMGTVSLQSAVGAAVEAALPLMQSRNQRLEIGLPQPPPLLHADAGRVEQVLTNLLSNAAKYTPPGGRIRLLARRIGPAEGTSHLDEVEIAVHDTGIGLDANDCERIFGMFSQVDSAASAGPGGLGIGLALVKGLVELHGGRVSAYSEGLGHGSVFTVVLPSLPEGSLVQQPVGAPVTSARPLRVLIADDNADAAESLSMLLQMAGHVTHTAADGLAAMSASARFEPHVALLDIGMPGLNGYEVAQRLRADPSRAGMLLVALTGWASPDNREQGRLAGFDLCFSKPINADELLRLLASTHLSEALT